MNYNRIEVQYGGLDSKICDLRDTILSFNFHIEYHVAVQQPTVKKKSAINKAPATHWGYYDRKLKQYTLKDYRSCLSS